MEFKYEIDNTYIHYVKFGSGSKNLVMLSGISLSGFEGFGSAIEKQYECLKEDYTCYVFDRKKKLNENSSIFDLARDLKVVLDDLGVNKAILFGVSQGGMIALAFSLLYPDIVEKLLICSSSAKPGEMSNSLWEKLRNLIDENDIYNFNMELFKSIYSNKYFEENKKALERIANNGEKEELSRFKILTRQIDNFDIIDRLSEIKCPSYVVSTKKDKVFSYEESIELSKRLNCPLYLYEDEAHALYDEAKDFIFIIKDFLDN